MGRWKTIDWSRVETLKSLTTLTTTMGRSVTNVERETVQQHKFALEREVVTVECDDGAEYVFEKPTDRPQGDFRLARRVQPDGELSTSSAPIPSAVSETIETVVSGWTK